MRRLPLALSVLATGLLWVHTLAFSAPLQVTTPTFLKLRRENASTLADNEKCAVPQGTVLDVVGRPRYIGANHYWIQFSPLSGGLCPYFNQAYVYGPHIGIPRTRAGVEIVAFRDATLRQRESQQTSPGEQCVIPKGTVIVLQAGLQLMTSGDYRLQAEPMTVCPGFENAFLFGEDFGVVAPDGVPLVLQQESFLKLRLASSANLAPAERCTVPAGAAIVTDAKPPHAGENHVLVQVLSENRCGFTSAYLYGPHVGLDFTPKPKTGEQLVAFYRENYDSIKAKVGFTSNGCAAFATTALATFGLPVGYTAWAPTMDDNLAKMGWKRINDWGQLVPGDVVFTRESPSDTMTNHVFIFGGYVAGSNEKGYAIDNQNNYYVRGLNGSTGQSRFWHAFRVP